MYVIEQVLSADFSAGPLPAAISKKFVLFQISRLVFELASEGGGAHN